MGILVVLGIIVSFLGLLVFGVHVLSNHDDMLLDVHPPDPDHRHWPDGGDDV